MELTEEQVEAVYNHIKTSGISQRILAESIGLKQPHLSRCLNSRRISKSSHRDLMKAIGLGESENDYARQLHISSLNVVRQYKDTLGLSFDDLMERFEFQSLQRLSSYLESQDDFIIINQEDWKPFTALLRSAVKFQEGDKTIKTPPLEKFAFKLSEEATTKVINGTELSGCIESFANDPNVVLYRLEDDRFAPRLNTGDYVLVRLFEPFSVSCDSHLKRLKVEVGDKDLCLTNKGMARLKVDGKEYFFEPGKEKIKGNSKTQVLGKILGLLQ